VGAQEVDRQAIGCDIATAVKQTIGISVEVVVHGPGEVVRSEGKAVRVVDNRN
jgi:phenylacetate-CoA ligase